MTNVIYHTTLVRTVRSFPKHHSLAGGTGRAWVSFSALQSPCSLQQGAGKKCGQQQRQFIHNILQCLGKKIYSKLQRSITSGSYCALCKAERGEMWNGVANSSCFPSHGHFAQPTVKLWLCTYIPEQIHTNIQPALLLLLQSSSPAPDYSYYLSASLLPYTHT